MDEAQLDREQINARCRQSAVLRRKSPVHVHRHRVPRGGEIQELILGNDVGTRPDGGARDHILEKDIVHRLRHAATHRIMAMLYRAGGWLLSSNWLRGRYWRAGPLSNNIPT